MARSPGLPRVLLAAAAVAGVLAAGTGAARVDGDRATVVSPNWSGYLVTGKPGTRYTSVTGTWREPTVSCGRHASGFATIAVGLGGYGRGAQGDEQVGTDANCDASGKPVYYGWFDIAPYPAYGVPHTVSPGDLVTATVTIEIDARPPLVKVELENATAGWKFAREISWVSPGSTVQQPGAQNAGGSWRPAASSAEWLVEAPSSCHYEACTQASLANFGSVGMTGISAAADGVAGSLNDPRWKVVRLRLVPGKVHLPSYPRATPFSRNPVADGIAASPAGATPGPASLDGRSFKVKWRPVAGKDGL